VGWQRLFDQPACAQIGLDSLEWHRRHIRRSLFAYTLMLNHLHAIKPEGAQTISSLLQSFGSFTAHAILAHLERGGRRD
jgi:hypothetical protein